MKSRWFKHIGHPSIIEQIIEYYDLDNDERVHIDHMKYNNGWVHEKSDSMWHIELAIVHPNWIEITAEEAFLIML